MGGDLSFLSPAYPYSEHGPHAGTRGSMLPRPVETDMIGGGGVEKK